MEKCSPVSTKVIRQSDMSVLNRVTSRAAVLEDEIVRPRLVVMQEEILHRRRAIPQAENEIGVAEVGVVPHDVPQQRSFPDVRHRLRARW